MNDRRRAILAFGLLALMCVLIASGLPAPAASQGVSSWPQAFTPQTFSHLPLIVRGGTPQPGLLIQGYVRLESVDGPGLANVSIIRRLNGYYGEQVATTDANGYYQTDFEFFPGDETVRVWTGLTGYLGYQSEPAWYEWQHYFGYEAKTLDFIAHQVTHTPTPTSNSRPTANFDASPLQGTVPLTVTFVNRSSGAIRSCFWDYGDGARGGVSCWALSHTHIYTQTGSFTVSLTVSRENGLSDTLTRPDYISASSFLSALTPTPTPTP